MAHECCSYPQSPEAARDVFRLLQLLRRERYSTVTSEEIFELAQLEARIEQMNGVEVVNIFLNNPVILSACLTKYSEI